MGFEILELLGSSIELTADVADLRAGGPVQPFGDAAELERQQAEIEHLQNLLARRERIVIALHEASLVDRAVRLEQILHRLRQLIAARIVLGRIAGDAKLIERRVAESVEDE